MSKRLLFYVLCLLPFCSLQAQRRTEEVLSLANHWTLRGTIFARTDSSICIRTRDGNVFSFPITQVVSISREPVWRSEIQTRSRWSSYTELGPLIAGRTNVNGVTTAAFSFQTLVGYSFHGPFSRSDSMPAQRSRNFFIIPFLGIGADLYATQTILPIFASVRADLLRNDNITVFGFGDAGYGLDITQRTDPHLSYKGGLLYAAGVGVRIPFNQRAGFLLSLGYRYQHTTFYTDGIPADATYRRLALRAGFYL